VSGPVDEDWFPLVELTARLGALAWAEQAVGDCLQKWSAIEPDPVIAVFFDTAGRHHQWHAHVIRDCLPAYESLRENEPEQPPSPGWAAAIDAMGSLHDPDSTAARLRVLAKSIDPWFERELGMLMELANPVSDAGVSRWLRFVTLDHAEDGARAAVFLSNRSDDAVRLEDHHRLQLISRSVVELPEPLS